MALSLEDVAELSLGPEELRARPVGAGEGEDGESRVVAWHRLRPCGTDGQTGRWAGSCAAGDYSSLKGFGF